MALSYRSRYLSLVKANEQAMKGLFTTLAHAIASEVTRRADADGNVPRSATFEIQQAAGQHVQRMFLGRNQRGELAPFDTLINGAVIPLAPYMRQLWESIRVAVRIPIEQAAVILSNKLPDDVLAVMKGATRNPFVAAKAKVAEQVFRPNPLAVYDAPHEWVDPNGYRLSDRVWNTAAATRRHLDLYLDSAIREGRGALTMSRELERFLTPGRTLLTTNAPYGTTASFDAMRLARTEITRASGHAAEVSATMNPFVSGMKWNLSSSHPRFDVCDGYASGGPNGGGVYALGELPSYPAHPHCLCYLTNVMVDAGQSAEILGELRTDIQRTRQEFVNLVGPVQVEAFERLLMGQGLTVERSGLGAVSRVVVPPAVTPVVTPVAPVVAPPAPPAIPPAQIARQQVIEIDRAGKARLAQIDAEIGRVSQALSETSVKMDKLEQSLAKRAGTPQEAQIRAHFETERNKRSGLFDERRALEAERGRVDQEYIIRARGAVQVERPARVEFYSPPGDADATAEGRRNWAQGVDEFNRLVSPDVAPARRATFVELDDRPYYSLATKNIRLRNQDGAQMVTHELGHWLEDHNPDVARKATEFYNRRTQGYALESMGPGYSASEVTRRDKFIHPYMGKMYNDGATEITSMGLEYFYNKTARLAKDDPDMFDFIFNLLRGL